MATYLIPQMIWGDSIPPTSGQQLRSSGRFLRPAVARTVQCLHEPVKKLLDDNGCDIEEAVNAAGTAHNEGEVGHPVQGHVRVVRFLGSD
ncbi:hypothetical protein TNCT_318301 [Trichonephila clavata]|uniref:Uncharacterized protein n=1 Tax=Trichonephila clavata TaxID=2740835 RepID=A0A8X6G1H0_TRICU|nr:hypothetical protein TNCT_318301 [Trichonephila clavata]